MTRQSTKDFFKEYFSKEEPKKKLFKPSVNEDLNRPHNVTLTEGEISTILYNLEGTYGHLLDGEIPEEVQTIFSKLEGVVDTYYNVGKCISEGNDYADCVDTLVERM